MVFLVTLFTYSNGAYTLCQVGSYFFTFVILKKDSLNFVHWVNVGYGKDKNCLYQWNWCIADDWHFRCQAARFILRLSVWSYWDLLTGKHYAKSLHIKSVGTATFMPGSNSESLKLHFLLAAEEQEMPDPQRAASCVSWTLATDGQRLLAGFIWSDSSSSLTMPCSGVLDAE